MMGAFTFANLAQITTPENLKASGNVPAAVIFEYTDSVWFWRIHLQ